jgi:hypothetical protein
MRLLLGPWRWMRLISLVLDERVVVVTIKDARAAAAPTAERQPGAPAHLRPASVVTRSEDEVQPAIFLLSAVTAPAGQRAARLRGGPSAPGAPDLTGGRFRGTLRSPSGAHAPRSADAARTAAGAAARARPVGTLIAGSAGPGPSTLSSTRCAFRGGAGATLRWAP